MFWLQTLGVVHISSLIIQRQEWMKWSGPEAWISGLASSCHMATCAIQLLVLYRKMQELNGSGTSAFSNISGFLSNSVQSQGHNYPV